MKILHTADIHLREYGDERWKCLQRLIEIGSSEAVELLLISGDLFDKDIDAETLRPNIREIFSNTSFKILIIPGNHDMDSYKKGMYFGEDAVVITDLYRPFEYKGISIWGMPFEPIEGKKILHKLHSIERYLPNGKQNILMYHGELMDAFFSRGDFGDEGEERYMPVRLSYFADLPFDYVLGGHFHSRFDVRKLEKGGYFVYPGSPISITRKETGRRCVNIFEPGGPPREYFIDTPHFEEVVIEFDPFVEANPVDLVEKGFRDIHPSARVILRVRGFINCKSLGMNEMGLVEQINRITEKECVDTYYYEFKDVHMILEDDLFKCFLKKLEQTDENEDQKRQMRDMAIRAIMVSRS